MNRNEEQERYRPRQVFWRRHQNDLTQDFSQNTFASTTTVLAPFQAIQPAFAQAGFCGNLPLAPTSTPPLTETPDPQQSPTIRSGKAATEYRKWGDEEKRLLV